MCQQGLSAENITALPGGEQYNTKQTPVTQREWHSRIARGGVEDTRGSCCAALGRHEREVHISTTRRALPE